MRTTFVCALLALALSAACGDASTPDTSAAPGPDEGSGGLIVAATVDACAGFDTTKAGELLGVPASRLQDYSETIGSSRQCLFRDPEDRDVAVGFTLKAMPSVARAVRSMASEREAMQMAQGSIADVTGTTVRKPAVAAVDGLGDEAFDSMVGMLVVRVNNAIVMVSNPEDEAGQRRVATALVEALRK